MVRLADEEQIKRLLDPEGVVAAIERGFGQRFHDFVMPARQHMDLPSGGVLLVMPCSDRSAAAVGVKLVVVLDSAALTNGSVQATYVLLSATTGQPELVMPANYLTDIRTAATSGLATSRLARPDATTLGIFGTGRQAWAHVLVLARIRKFERILVCGSSPDRVSQFAQRAAKELRLSVEPADARTCAAKADVLCTCTNSRTPLFDGSLLSEGTHLNLVGAFRPDDREVDDLTVQRARVVVDTYEGAFAEAGDLLVPLRNRRITRDHVLADLHELVSGSKQVRRSSQDITLFKSVGCALEDLVTAELIRQHLGL